MKKLLLVFVASLIVFGCQKQASTNLRPEKVAKATKEINFYNQENKGNIPKYEKGVVLFKLKDNSSLSRVAGRSSTERIFTKAMEKAKDRGFYKIRIKDEQKTLADLKKNPDVEWASLNYAEVTQTTPDDPYYTSGDMWGLANINMPPVWQSGNFGNKQVVVGVIDEGIFSHDDLCPNIWTNPHEIDNNGIDDDGNGYIDDMHGWDWFNNDKDVYPGATHGTHVAGTIGAKGGNQVGVIGVNSNVTLISCKFLEQFGYDDNAVKAIDYLIDLKQRHGINIKVTSNSWGGGGFNQGLLEAIQRAKAADILFVAAAGNHGANNDIEPNFPCGYDVDNIISVGASDWSNNKASFSCFGPTTVDIFAPGVGIVSTIPTDQHTSGYAFFSGTSMATPHVSGAAALYAGLNPEANYLQIKNAILSSASKLPQLKGLCLGDATGGNFLNVSTFTGQTGENQAPFYECPIITPDVTPPTIPQNLRVTDVGFDPRPGPFYGGYYGITWEKSTDNTGVGGYVLVENGIATWFLAGNNYVLAGIQDTSVDIIVQVYAVDGWGNVSSYSNADTVIWNQTPTPPDTQAPSIPSNPTVSNATISSLKLSWGASSDNVGVTGYKINWRAVGGSWLETTVTSTSNTFNNLSEGTAYEFNVQARDAAGNFSSASVTVQGSTLEDNPPPSFTISSDLEGLSPQVAGNVRLTWNTTTNGTISQVRVERRKGSGAFVDLGDNLTTSPSGSYIDNDVVNPGQYSYRIKTTISQGVTAYSDIVSIQIKKK